LAIVEPDVGDGDEIAVAGDLRRLVVDILRQEPEQAATERDGAVGPRHGAMAAIDRLRHQHPGAGVVRVGAAVEPPDTGQSGHLRSFPARCRRSSPPTSSCRRARTLWGTLPLPHGISSRAAKKEAAGWCSMAAVR